MLSMNFTTLSWAGYFESQRKILYNFEVLKLQSNPLQPILIKKIVKYDGKSKKTREYFCINP